MAKPSQVPAAPGTVRANATVLDDGDGPELCLGGVATSLPPQCGGPPVEGWDWSRVEHEDVSGVRWGSYQITGRFDGATFTVAEICAAVVPGHVRTDVDIVSGA